MHTCDPIEGIIERVDGYCSETLAQELARELREAASRGFFLSSKAPLWLLSAR